MGPGVAVAGASARITAARTGERVSDFRPENPSMEPTQQLSLNSELEKLAEGLESRDFHFAGTCAFKALHILAPPQTKPDAHALEQEAVGTDWVHEASKAIKALENKDQALASMCLRKAVKAYRAKPEPPARATLSGEPAEYLRHFEQLASCISSQEWTSAAERIRRLNELAQEVHGE